MGSRYECFFLEPALLAEESLRRFSTTKYLKNPDGSYKTDSNGRCLLDEKSPSKCPGSGGYHNAVVILGQCPWTDTSIGGRGEMPDETKRQDPRWPVKCDSCDYVFLEDDIWQCNTDQLYRRQDTGELMTLSRAPIGAMWNANWMPSQYRGPDGLYLVVRTPGGDWTVDGPSHNNGRQGAGWTRTGTVPKVTVRPSIGMGKATGSGWAYHGFLTNGVLEACPDSPT